MHNFIGLVHSLLAAAGTPGSAEVTGMRWDGWMMLIFAILLLYGGLGWCLWAAGRGKREAWTEDEVDEEEQAV